MAKSQSDTGTLLLMSAHYATNQTLAHILRGNALTIRLSQLVATSRRVILYTQSFGNPQNWGLHSAPDIVLVSADAGSHLQTTHVSLESLSSALSTEESDGDNTIHTHHNWSDPLPSTEATRIKRHTDASHVPRYILHDLIASEYDAESTAAPSRISSWVLLVAETQTLFEGGHGKTPYLIYARDVPDTPDPAWPSSFDKTSYATSFS
jgi:hypothetical protein